MTRSSNKELITPFENSESVFRSKRRLFETHGLVESSLQEFDLFSEIKEHSEEETTKIMTETIEQYMSKTRGNYGSGIVRPKINDKTHFELKGQYLKELLKNTFSGLEHEDANEHIKKSLRSLTYFIFPREINKVNEKVYAAQVGCELCKGPHYTKDCPLKEEGNTLEEAYYTQFGAPYQPTLEESLTKFMAESAKRHKENSNIINEIRASTDAAIRNRGASIKNLEIQIGQMSKDKDDHEGKSPAGALIDIPVFVGKFSILTGFIIIDDEDVTRDVALSMPFFMKYVSCQMIMKKFAHGDKCERMMDK
ncbi:hypothetical protein Tco_0330981 [Tanacetum coccineum]